MYCSSAAKLVPTSYLLKIGVEVEAYTLHISTLWLAVSKGMFPVKYVFCNKSYVLCQLNYMKIIRVSQN